MRISLLLFFGAFLIACQPETPHHNIKEYSSWQHYLGDPARTHYSSLDQIDTANVSQLQLAWSYNSGGLEPGRTTQIQTNPLIVGSTLYGVNAALQLFALDASTGEELWKFVPPSTDNSGLGLNRGLSYWESTVSDQRSRLFFSSGAKMYAIDPETGRPILSFGDNGSIDLREGLGRDPSTLSVVANTPGAIFKEVLIMGTRVGEGPGSSPGHIRAYDVITGAIEWTFHTIPQPGEQGYDTWPEEAFKTVGGANSWAGIAIDKERGIAYVPTGSAAFDWYGGDRHGANLYANSLLALNAKTGERLWHFQMVHHDLWDRDLPAPPNLLEISREGETIPAVAQVTKSGHVFVFNRVTGEPLFPIEEKAYPPSELAGERAYATQPLPSLPQPFARQQLSEKDLYAPNRPAFVDDFVDKDQNIDPPTVLEKFRSITSKGQFVPIDTTGVVLYPGADGGAEWGGAALDPRSGILYVNSNEMAWIVRMQPVSDAKGKTVPGQALSQIHCARCHGGGLQGLAGIPELLTVKDRFSRDTVRGIIQYGKGAMPGMPNLSETEVNAITAFIMDIQEATDHRAEAQSIAVPYAVGGFGRFKDDRGFPVVKPPWGTLNAIDLNTGDYLWKIPLGHEEALNDPDIPVSGTENYGGPVITKGGVLFIAATRDEKIRAFRASTGELLWEDSLPAGGYASPATYAVNGKQFRIANQRCIEINWTRRADDVSWAWSMPGQAHFDRMRGYGLGSVREQLGAGWTIGVVRFDVGVGGGAAVDVVHETGGGEPASAALAALQRMLANQFVPDDHRAHVFLVFHPDGIGGADIGTGTAPDTAIRLRHHEGDPLYFLHFQGSRTDDLFTHPDAQPAAQTRVRRWSHVNAVGLGHLTQSSGLGCQLQHFFKCLGAGCLNDGSRGLEFQPILHLENAGKHGDLPSAAAGYLHRAQFAGTGWSEGRMIAQGRDRNMVGTSHVQGRLTLLGLVGLSIDGNGNHISILFTLKADDFAKKTEIKACGSQGRRRL